MSYYRVGKTTLPRGVPLRIAVGMASDEPSPSRSPGGGAHRPDLLLVSSETAPEGEYAPVPSVFEPSRASEDGRFLFEVATEAFSAGPFELLIRVGDEERAQLGEEIWVLEREDYDALLRELGDEEFLPSPSLHGAPAAADYVEGLIRERLLEDNFALDESRLRFRRSIPEGIADEPFPSSPIRWTTEQVLDAFRNVALFGVKDASWEVELTQDRYDLRCNGELLDPLSDAALSYVDWATGEELPLQEICALAHERGALTLIDGAQGAGNVPVDAGTLGVDMYAFTGHKWLLGPEGMGALYIRPGLVAEGLSSTNIGFMSLTDPTAFDAEGGYEDHLHEGARRFESSTMSPALAAGFAAATEAVNERGTEGFQEIRRCADLLMNLLSEQPRVTIRSPRPAHSGLVAFEVTGVASKDAAEKLLDQEFVARYIPEPYPYIRASTHLFNAEAELEAFAEAVHRL